MFGGLIRLARAAKRFVLNLEARSIGLGTVGEDVRIGAGCEFSSPANVHLGDHVYIGNDCWLTSPVASIHVGNYVMLASQVALITGDNNFRVIGRRMFEVHDKRADDDADIVIEDDVWVGFRSVILKGVRLGRGCVVGAGSVVNRDVEPYAVVAGAPARVVGCRFTPDQIVEHEELIRARES